MDPSQVTKDESQANKVIEYYKKYTQNPDLIKYFTGPEASFAEKRTLSVEIRNNVQLPQHVTPSSNVNVQNDDASNCIIEASSYNSPASLDVEINQIVEIDEVEEKTDSRSSSVASNKIEWDNGADIGYSNLYKLSAKKSASFPSLLPSNISVNCNVLPTVSQEKSVIENKEELRKMYHQLTFSSDTSNSTNKEINLYEVSKEPSVESSSLQESRIVKSSTQSSSSDSSLKRKIGDPVAYSTPHEGPSSKESNSNSSNHYEESTSKSSNKFEGYTVTPMLNLPISKRKLNTDKPLKLSEQQSIKRSDKNKNSPKKNVIQKVDKFQKKINLCLTKPISVECISVEGKESVHKDVQTSFSSEKSSKCVQTEELHLDSIVFEPVTVCSPLTHKIEYVRFASQNSSEDKSPASSNRLKKSLPECCITTKGNSVSDTENLEISENRNLPGKSFKSTQTDVINKKVVKNGKIMTNTEESVNNKNREIRRSSRTQKNTYYDKSSVSSSVNSSRYTSDDKTTTSGNINSRDFGSKTPVAADEFQTEELLLTEMISLNHSKDLNTDIKRSIDILQRLLKSRKYDQATKKHYIKKIVQKIVDSKYSDDSTNSDLFRPKKNLNDHQFIDKGENQMPNTTGTSQLMDNKPWYPASKSVYTLPKTKCKKSEHSTKGRERNLETKNNRVDSNVIRNHTFRLPIREEAPGIPQMQANLPEVDTVWPTDILPPNVSASKENQDQNFKQKITNSAKSHNVAKETSRVTSDSSCRLADSTSPDKENRPSSSDGKTSNANWRTCKTLSEKLLETRDSIDFRKGQGDYLLHVVKEERHHQLSWINNEIEHLLKLKELLEKKPKSMKPESQLKDVISSLLKMKVGDMKGLPKNFEVLVCKPKKSKEKCNPNGHKIKEIQKAKKKSASLTPDYYTIETQLDPDGNLLDLTVYDGSGNRKYNYRSDGVVEDVSISSKNHNTEVKLKPKMDEYPGPHNVCRACGRSFTQPASDTDVSLCKECFDDIAERTFGTSKNVPNNYKICKTCGKLFIPSRGNPNLCICKKCYEEEPQPEQKITPSDTEECEACGRLFVPQDNDSPLCLCENCEKRLVQEEKQLYHQKQSYKICNICGENFMSTKKYADQDICEECSQLVQQAEMRCACQKVTFSDPLELGVCKCINTDAPLKQHKDEWSLKDVPTKSTLGKSFEDIEEHFASEFCPQCGKDMNDCMCGLKFLPKKPKLVGNEDVEELNVSKGYPCDCIGVQANLSVKTKSPKYPFPHSIHQKRQRTSGTSDSSRTKRSNFYKDHHYPKSPASLRPNTSSSSQSSRGSSKSTPRRTMPRSQNQAKKDKCCRACLKCAEFSPKPSSRAGSIQRKSSSILKKLSPIESPRGSMKKPPSAETDKDSVHSVQMKKSCQCCTCTNCGIQTKKLGDKNVRCQCCICLNCGTQVSLDTNGKQQKNIKSKNCQPKSFDSHTNEKKKKNEYRILNKKKNGAKSKRDELDHTDESLQSISSGNIVCITPTKYKNIGNEKSDSECQCVILNNKSSHDTDQHKSLQINPSILKALCKSVNATSNTQERRPYMCPPNCPQGASVQTPSPLQEIQRNGDTTNRSDGSSKGLQTQDEVPSMSSNPPANVGPKYSNHHNDIQVFMCTNKNPTTSAKQKISDQTKCSCGLEMCKCSQTTTHEEKDVQCPASKQCTCQTEPKEDANVQCNCKAHAGMTCNCDEVNHDKGNLCRCKKSSSSSSNSNSDSESYLSCICCKKEKILKNLMNKIPLCGPCEEVNQNNFYPHKYSNPLHSCLCYNLVERNILYQFKQTLTELERLDIYQQYCEVLKNCKCCKKCGCKCKLPKQFKNGCAYFLKLEDACPNTHCKENGTSSDSSNYEEDRKNYLPEVTVKVPNCNSSCARKKENERDTKKYKSCPSIQNYLCTMKPDFVERAERRRLILKDATSQREENSEHRKLKFIDKINYLNQKNKIENFSSETNIFKPYGYQTKAYCVFDIELNESPKRVQPRIFKSFKEMKDLTRRKYLHLNEVRSKKDVHREKRLREANRLLANTFTRRLQKSTLRGAVDIPLNVRVVTY